MSSVRLSKIIILLYITLLAGYKGVSQEAVDANEGKVSYVTSQNIYVKFASTDHIEAGDTLFINESGNRIPALIVKSTSSISVVCVPIGTRQFSVGDTLMAPTHAGIVKQTAEPVSAVEIKPVTEIRDSTKNDPIKATKSVQKIFGNVTVASYLNFSDVTSTTQRMRYTVNFNAENIGNSKASAEVYITFAHKLDQWSEIQEDVFNGLKIYNLSVNYKFSEHHQVWFGRKINPRISNVGAIDGLQYEGKIRSVSIGIVGGSRPDYQDYSFDPALAQIGGYVGHDLTGKNGYMQTTLAFMQQMNSGKTDRRFAYLQHANALVKNLYFFGSMEVDLYKLTLNPEDSTYKQNNSPSLSNLYLSLRYRPIRMLSFTLSYSSRQNVIYYESYKDYLETLLQQATVQGWIGQVNIRPSKYMTIGVNGSYRDSKQDPKPTKSLYGYLTYSVIPGIGASGTLSATWLETAYMSGKIYSLSLSRDLMKGKLNAGLGYRFVDYKFASNESTLFQHMPEFNLTWRIMKKLSCSLFYEGTFDKNSTFNRIYINFVQRF